MKSFSSGLQVDGFSIAARANAQTRSSDIEIIGPGGFSFYDKKFGPSAEAAGGLSGGPGLSQAEFQTGNVEYVTLSRNPGRRRERDRIIGRQRHFGKHGQCGIANW